MYTNIEDRQPLSLWLKFALLCLPGSQELGCSWKAPKCEHPRSSVWPNANVRMFLGSDFWKTLNCHIYSTFKTVDLIPKLRARIEYQLYSGTKYKNKILCDLHYLDTETIQSFLDMLSGPQSNAIKYKFMTWIGSLSQSVFYIFLSQKILNS